MYAKLFRQIYESSIAEDYESRHVFMDMVVLADSDGVVDMTHEAISRITNVPLEIIKRAISKLESPDSRSRTPDYEGCRLIKLDDHRDWGWLIVNYAKFRGTATEEKRREQTRLRVKRLRERQSLKPRANIPLRNACNALHGVTSPSPSPSSSALQEEGPGETQVDLPPRFPRTVDDAIRQASNMVVDAPFVTLIWNKAMSRNGCDNKGIPISSFQHHLATEWSYEQNRRNKEKINSAAARTEFPRDIKLQMDAIQRQIDNHPANRDSVNCNGNPTDLERASLRDLRKKWNELNNRLANGS